MEILQTIITFSTAICLLGSFLLFYFSNGVRARKLLAVILLAWGLAFFMIVIDFIIGKHAIFEQILPPFYLCGGVFFSIILLVWPLEVVKPGWLNTRRFLQICSPLLLATVFYFGIIHIFNLPEFKLKSFDMFLSHISYFSVWFRVVLLALTVPYIAYILGLVFSFYRVYRRWCEDNYSSMESFDISWLIIYGIWAGLIAVAYFVNMAYAEPVSLIVHNSISGAFFLWLMIKALKHENPYPEFYFDERKGGVIAEIHQDSVIADNDTFDIKKGEYKQKILEWLESEKPYLNPKFSLMDVVTVIPLNRTYLSRIFNEEFGMSFSSVVREYRMREAKFIMSQNPDLPISEVSEKCGYSTPQAFHRAFVTTNGVTPKSFICSCKEEI